MKLSLLIFFALLLMSSQPTLAEIYRWVDKNGDIKFSDRKPSKSKQAKVLELKIKTVKSHSANDGTNLFLDKRVIIYSASWCGVCRKAKKYFKQQGIKYKEYDIEKSAKGRSDYTQLKGTGVPIIMIGKKRLNGFSISSFEKNYRS